MQTVNWFVFCKIQYFFFVSFYFLAYSSQKLFFVYGCNLVDLLLKCLGYSNTEISVPFHLGVLSVSTFLLCCSSCCDFHNVKEKIQKRVEV